MALLIQVSHGIEAASNQLTNSHANHRTYRGDVGLMSDYWEGFTKGLGYRHVASRKKKKLKTLQTCHCLVITYFCCDYVASYLRFLAGVGRYETKPEPSSTKLYISLVLTVFNNVHDCYLLTYEKKKKSIIFYNMGNCFVASLACCVGLANVWLTLGEHPDGLRALRLYALWFIREILLMFCKCFIWHLMCHSSFYIIMKNSVFYLKQQN